MPAKHVKIKPVVHQELRNISSAVAAFSIATVLMGLQGSFGPGSMDLTMSMALFVAAGPMCVTASLLSFIFSQREHVPDRSDKILDWLMRFGVGLGASGFLSLLRAKSTLLTVVFALSAVVSFMAIWMVVRSIDGNDGDEVDNDDEMGGVVFKKETVDPSVAE